MNVTFTEAARTDLDELLAYTKEHYPSVVPKLEQRINEVIARVARRPESARAVQGRPGVHVVPLLRYPCKIFYRVGRRGDRNPPHPSHRAPFLTRMRRSQ